MFSTLCLYLYYAPEVTIVSMKARTSELEGSPIIVSHELEI